MAVDMTDPAAVLKFLQSKNAVANNVPAPQQSAPSAPPPTYGMPQPSTVPAPSYGAPAPPKDMSGFKSSLPTFGMPPAPASNPVPAPAPTATQNSTGGVSGTLSTSQRQTYDSLPPEQRAAFLMSLGSGGAAPPMPTGTAQPPKAAVGSYPGTPTVPAPNMGYPTKTPDQIKAEVAAKIAAETAKRASASSQAKTGIQTNYERLRTNVGQDRVLQDVTTARNANPYSGKTSYDKGISNMERERTDREQSEDLQTRLANIDVSFKDYLDATPAQQQEMENAAMQQERAYALQVDQLNYGRQRDATSDKRYDTETAYNQGQDKVQNDRNAANDALALRKQHIDEANYYSDKYGITVEPKDDFQQVIDQVKGLPTAAQQSAAQKAESDERSEAWKVVETLGYVPQGYEKILGIPAGTQTQKAKEAAMDAAYKNRSAATADKNAETSAKNAETSAKNAETAANKPAPEKPKSYESDPGFGEDLQDISKSPSHALQDFQSRSAEYIAVYGYDGLQALIKEAERQIKASQPKG